MSLSELAILIIAALGVIFMGISSIGMMRLPDIYARMHAAGKASTLGVSCLLLAAGIFYGADLFWRMVALVVLFFVTAPIATSAIARAAHRYTSEENLILEHDDMAGK